MCTQLPSHTHTETKHMRTPVCMHAHTHTHLHIKHTRAPVHMRAHTHTHTHTHPYLDLSDQSHSEAPELKGTWIWLVPWGRNSRPPQCWNRPLSEPRRQWAPSGRQHWSPGCCCCWSCLRDCVVDRCSRQWWQTRWKEQGQCRRWEGWGLGRQLLLVLVICLALGSQKREKKNHVSNWVSNHHLTWYLMSTETIRLIRNRETGEGNMEVGEEGDYIPITTLSPPEWCLH